ncbi:sigma-70 family RNA polymerase sigma factor [Pedococcus bigeumensis]|uniref:RNA polymerase sigma factor n=1 Tax=Pedococcus bigeumensis TaxID=433644 RepID=UPI0031D104B2
MTPSSAMEAFARMLRALANGHGPSDNAPAYLAVSVRNLAARHGRRLGHRHAPATADDRTLHTVPDPGQGVDHAVLTEEARRDLLDALGALHPSWREVPLLTHVEELSVAEAAARLGITPGAVSALSYRGRRALRRAYLDRTPA